VPVPGHALPARPHIFRPRICFGDFAEPLDAGLHFAQLPKFKGTGAQPPSLAEDHLATRVLQGGFPAAFVRIADGMRTAPGIPLPLEEVLILGEERAGGEQKYSACTLPPSTSLITLVEIMKRRWVCEHRHRELKQEVGLSHVKGHLWLALCHHVVLCLLDPGFLQWLRFTQPVEIFDATVPAIRTELAEELPQPVFCSWCRVKPTHPAGP